MPGRRRCRRRTSPQPIEGEAASDAERLSGGHVGLDLGVASETPNRTVADANALMLRWSEPPIGPSAMRQCPVCSTPSCPRMSRQRATASAASAGLPKAIAVEVEHGVAAEHQDRPRTCIVSREGESIGDGTSLVLGEDQGELAGWSGDGVLVDAADHDLRFDAGGLQQTQSGR